MAVAPGTPPNKPLPAASRAGETGNPGPLRLFNRVLGGQVSRLLPLALFGLIAGQAA